MSLAVAAPPHPQWLCEGLVLGTFPWHQATSMTYAQFIEKYTLHDSTWVGVFQDVAQQGDTVACLRWDQLWLPDGITAQLSVSADLYLLIKFTQISGMAFSEADRPPFRTAVNLGNSGNATANSPRLPKAIVKTELVDVEGNQVFLVDDAQGGSVTIIFEGNPAFLAIDSHSQIISL